MTRTEAIRLLYDKHKGAEIDKFLRSNCKPSLRWGVGEIEACLLGLLNNFNSEQIAKYIIKCRLEGVFDNGNKFV